VDRSKINPQAILESAQRIMWPYKITRRYCDWWTAYQIGQTVGDSFSLRERVFLAGDAVHTHSPKAGQGMNVSMQDSMYEEHPAKRDAAILGLMCLVLSIRSRLESRECG
jgi:FAD binding domain